MMSGTSREEENEEDGISIKAPPSDAFSKLSLMEIVLPEEDDATSEGKPRENEKDDKGEVNGQTDDETACRRAKELLSHELPTFVTPLSASVLEICILALYVYVNSSEATTRTTTKPAKVDMATIELLWSEILRQISNIAVGGTASNFTVPTVFDVLNTYVSFVHISVSTHNQHQKIANVTFTNISQRVLPLLNQLYCARAYSSNSDHSPPLMIQGEKRKDFPKEGRELLETGSLSPSKSVTFLWSQMATYMQKIANANHSSILSDFRRQSEDFQLEPLQQVHSLIALACQRKLGNFTATSTGDDICENTISESDENVIVRYSFLHLCHHSIQSKLFTTSLYLLFLNTNYVLQRLKAELLWNKTNNNSALTFPFARTDNIVLLFELWTCTTTNVVSALEALLRELETWHLTVEDNTTLDRNDIFTQVIALWYTALVPSNFLDLDLNREERIMLCHRVGSFLSILGITTMRILSDSTVSSLTLCMKYLMDSLHWKNQAIGYLAWDPQMITASALTTSTLSHFTSPITTSTSITNIPVNQNIRKIGLSDGKVSSTTHKGEATLIDPIHIAAVLIGQSHTVHFLDVVDWKGIHLFLAYIPSNIAFCQDLAETLYLLGLLWCQKRNLDNAMSCFNGALEILLLRPPAPFVEETAPSKAHRTGDEQVGLSLLDGLKFGGDDIYEEMNINNELEESNSNDVLPASDVTPVNIQQKTTEKSLVQPPSVWTDNERWSILSKIELHRGMLLFPLDLLKALECFHHAKDYEHRSSVKSPTASSNPLDEVIHFHNSVQHFDQLSTVYSWIASAYRELGQSQQAIEFFQESIEYSKSCITHTATSTNAGNMASLWMFNFHAANGYFNMAVALDDLGMFDQSISKYNKAYSLLSTVWDEYCSSYVSHTERPRGYVRGREAIIGGSIFTNATKSSITSKALVLADMLEVWMCLGSVYLALHDQEKELNESEHKHQHKALECFMKGLMVFLEKWCNSSVPDNPFSVQKESLSRRKWNSRLFIDTYGQQLHYVTDFVAKYSHELMTLAAKKANGVEEWAHPPIFSSCKGGSRKNPLRISLLNSRVVNDCISNISDVESLEYRLRCLLERAADIIFLVTSGTYNALPKGETENQADFVKINFSTCLLVLSDVEFFLHDIESALKWIQRSYEGAEEFDCLYYYRVGVCYIRMRKYKEAAESFIEYLSRSEKEELDSSSLIDERRRNACYHLGYAYSQLGLYACSIEFYRQSLKSIDESAIDINMAHPCCNSRTAQIYQEMSYVYLLECSMKHDEFATITESPGAVGDFEGIRSLPSSDLVMIYMREALSYFNTAGLSNLEEIASYVCVSKQMGVLCRVLHNWDDAEEYFQASLSILGQLPGTNASLLEIASLSYEIGLLYYLRPKHSLTPTDVSCSLEDSYYLDSAEIFLRQALHIYEHKGRSETPRNIAHKVFLAKTWYQLGQVSKFKEPTDDGDSYTVGSIALEYMNEALSLMRDVHPDAIASLHNQRSRDTEITSETSRFSLWDLYTSEFMSQLYHDIGVAYFSYSLYDMAIECFIKSEDLRLCIINSMKIDAMMDSCTLDMDCIDTSHLKLMPSTPSSDFRFWSSVGNIHYMKLARTLNNMGVVYSKLDRCENSFLCLEQSLEIRTKRRELFWSCNQLSTAEYISHLVVENEYATALINMGHLQAKMHHTEKALECFEKAVEVLESLGGTTGSSSALLANLYHSKARCYASLHRWEDAKRFFVKSLHIRRQRDIEERKSDNALFVEADDDSLSDSYYRESVNTPLPVHDSNDESDSALRLSHTLHQLGIVHENLGDYREAMICYEEAWFIRKLHLTRDHVIMAQSLCRIGNLKLLDSCNYDVALKCFEEALRVQQKNLGDDALEVSETYYRMGMIHHVRKEFLEAKRCYTSALQIYQYHGVHVSEEESIDFEGRDEHTGVTGQQAFTNDSAAATMKEVMDAWSNLELAIFESNKNKSNGSTVDWSKLALNPKGCMGKMEEVILHLITLVDQYLVQPSAEELQKAGKIVMDTIQEYYTPEQPLSRSLPPPPSTSSGTTTAGPSPPQFVFDVQQQLCMIQE